MAASFYDSLMFLFEEENKLGTYEYLNILVIRIVQYFFSNGYINTMTEFNGRVEPLCLKDFLIYRMAVIVSEKF